MATTLPSARAVRDEVHQDVDNGIGVWTSYATWVG
jgi:hypothetical protein